MIKVHVLLFASAREAAGNVSSLDLEVPVDCDTQQFRTLLGQHMPALAKLLLADHQSSSLTLALNEEYVQPGQVLPLKDGDTVALIPPISGG